MLTLERQNAYRRAYQAAHPDWQPATARYAALVRAHLQPDSRLLDLGCGRGGLVEQLDHPLSKIAGIDPDLSSLKEHRLPLLPRAVGLSEALPLATASCDVAMCSWVLEHLAAPAQVFAEVGRVLKPGGVFIFLTPNSGHPLIWLNRLLSRLTTLQPRLVARFYGRAPDDTFPAYYRANRPAQLHQLAGQAGLALSRLEIIPDPTYWAIVPAFYPLLRRLDAAIPHAYQLHLVGVCQKPT